MGSLPNEPGETVPAEASEDASAGAGAAVPAWRAEAINEWDAFTTRRARQSPQVHNDLPSTVPSPALDVADDDPVVTELAHETSLAEPSQDLLGTAEAAEIEDVEVNLPTLRSGTGEFARIDLAYADSEEHPTGEIPVVEKEVAIEVGTVDDRSEDEGVERVSLADSPDTPQASDDVEVSSPVHAERDVQDKAENGKVGVGEAAPYNPYAELQDLGDDGDDSFGDFFRGARQR